MKDIYLEAARMVAEREYQFSCNAVYFAFYRNTRIVNTSECRLYVKTMLDDPDIELGLTDKNRNLRVLLLCMMAACYKDFL